MSDDETLMAGLRDVGEKLDRASAGLEATAVMARRPTVQPGPRRHLVSGLTAVAVLAAGLVAWTSRDDGDPVRTTGRSDTPMTEGTRPSGGPDQGGPCGPEALTADVDGDGRPDQVRHYWDADADLGMAMVQVCLGDGRELTTPGLGQAEALDVVDVEPDGRAEILAGGTGISSAGYLVITYTDGGLVPVELAGDALMVSDGALEHDDAGDTTQSAAFGCEDLAGDGRRELVQVTATFSGQGVSWTKLGYSLSGGTATQVSASDGTDALPSDRWAYPRSLTSSCSVAQPGSLATQVCAPYLEYLGSGADRLPDLAASLPPDAPAEVRTAVEHAQSDNFASTSVQTGANFENLDGWVRQQCDEVYLADVEARPSTDDAAQVLFDAVVVGDRAAAVKVAAANAVARFEPWGPVDAPPGAPQLSVVGGGTYRFQLTEGPDYFDCQGWDGVIRSCRLIQPSYIEAADPPGSQVAGICAEAGNNPVVTFTISLAAGVPGPRCSHAGSSQVLRVANETAEDLTVSFGRLSATVPPGQSYTFNETFAQVYEPGHHAARVVSAAIDWRLEIILDA